MNFSKGTFNLLLLVTILAVTFTSCKNDDDEQVEEINFSAENTAFVARVDNIVEGAQGLVEAGYTKTEEPGRMSNDVFGSCATFILNGGGDDSGTITIDFGDGCTLLNGAVVTGKIFMEYGSLVSGTRSITYEYQDFTYNQNGVTGGGTINRILENGEGFPQSTVNEVITVTLNGTSITANRDAFRVAEWVEGVGSGTWIDNVYRINGNWETTLNNGFERTGVVTIPLRREMDCLYYVSGRLQVAQEGLTGELDFGDGTCDAIATIIFEGQEFPVILGN